MYDINNYKNPYFVNYQNMEREEKIYKNDLLHFLVYNVNNLSLFEDCYNS